MAAQPAQGTAQEAVSVVKLVVQELEVHAPAAGAVRVADRPGAVRAVDGRRRHTRSPSRGRRALDPRQRRHLLAASTSSSCPPGGSCSPTAGNAPTSRSRPARPPSRSTSPPPRAATTLLRLVHRGLDDLAADAHHGGWTHYLDRLRRRRRGTATSGPIRSRPSASPPLPSCADERRDASRARPGSGTSPSRCSDEPM